MTTTPPPLDPLLPSPSKAAHPRLRGQQFRTQGLQEDSLLNLTEFSPLTEPAVPEWERERAYRIRQKQFNVTDRAFIPSSPAKRIVCPAIDGPIGGRSAYPEHKPDYKHDLSPRKKVVKNVPRLILTGPHKKGSYGVPGTQIGVYASPSGKKGVVGEYTYQSDPYVSQFDLARKIAKEERAKESPRPFVPTSPHKKGTYGVPGTSLYCSRFNGLDNGGIVGEYRSKGTDPHPIYGSPRTTPRKLESLASPRAFIPTSPPKLGCGHKFAAFDPYPEYKPVSFREPPGGLGTKSRDKGRGFNCGEYTKPSPRKVVAKGQKAEA